MVKSQQSNLLVCTERESVFKVIRFPRLQELHLDFRWCPSQVSGACSLCELHIGGKDVI